MVSFKNKNAVVTGAGFGIGLALSKKLVNRGAKVWMTDINKKSVDQASDILGAQARSVHLDVRDAGAIKNLVKQITGSEDGLDFIFNNAGIGVGGEMQDLTVAHFDRIIDVNIRTV